MTKMINTTKTGIKNLMRGKNKSSPWDSMTPIIPCYQIFSRSIIQPIRTTVRRVPHIPSAVSWMMPSKTTMISFTENLETSQRATLVPVLCFRRTTVIIGIACKPGREPVVKTSTSSPCSTIAPKGAAVLMAFRVHKCDSNIRGDRRKKIRKAGSPCRTKIRPNWTMAVVRILRRSVIFSEHKFN